MIGCQALERSWDKHSIECDGSRSGSAKYAKSDEDERNRRSKGSSKQKSHNDPRRGKADNASFLQRAIRRAKNGY